MHRLWAQQLSRMEKGQFDLRFSPHHPLPRSLAGHCASSRFGSSIRTRWCGPRRDAGPRTLIFFRWPACWRGKGARLTGPCLTFPLRSCHFAPNSGQVTDGYFAFPSLLPFSFPIRRLSLLATPDMPRFGSPRFNMHQNHSLTPWKYAAFRHAASIAYTL